MKVTVSKYLNVRVGKPSVNAPCYQYLAPGSEIDVDGKQYTGDNYEGLDVWMKDAAGNYYWSGGFAEMTSGSQSFPFQFDASKVAPWSRLNFEVSRFWTNYTGKNITIAVIDTGIFPHSDLKDAIDTTHQRSFVTDSVVDTDGHGTHVSGIIAARGITDMLGVAPEAKILPLKVVNSSNEAIKNQFLIDAVNYATSLAHVKIINLSLVADGRVKTEIDALNAAIQQAIVAGKIVVAASGNLAGNYISYPAKFANVISVASVEKDKSSQDESYALLSTSNYGKGTTIACPGLEIKSCINADKGPSFKDGTSMACAYMSGLIALKTQKSSLPALITQSVILSAISSAVFQHVEKSKNNIPVIDPLSFINS